VRTVWSGRGSMENTEAAAGRYLARIIFCIDELAPLAAMCDRLRLPGALSATSRQCRMSRRDPGGFLNGCRGFFEGLQRVRTRGRVIREAQFVRNESALRHRLIEGGAQSCFGGKGNNDYHQKYKPLSVRIIVSGNFFQLTRPSIIAWLPPAGRCPAMCGVFHMPIPV